MGHATIFAITSLTTEDLENDRQATLSKMANEAGANAAAMAVAMNLQHPVQVHKTADLSIGNWGKKIKREELTPEQKKSGGRFLFWSCWRGLVADPADAPAGVLDICWNTASELVTLALNPGQVKSQRPPHAWVTRNVFPMALIEPDGTFFQCVTSPDIDVFGETADGETASLYLNTSNARSWAKDPMAKIEEANFQAEYIRKLHQWPDHLVVEFDWNM